MSTAYCTGLDTFLTALVSFLWTCHFSPFPVSGSSFPIGKYSACHKVYAFLAQFSLNILRSKILLPIALGQPEGNQQHSTIFRHFIRKNSTAPQSNQKQVFNAITQDPTLQLFLDFLIKSLVMRSLGSYTSRKQEEPQYFNHGTGKKSNTVMNGRWHSA